MATTSYIGNALKVLQSLPSKSVQCICTSPPYWKLRDYQTGKWIGGDPTCSHVANKRKTKVQGNAAFNENRPSRELTIMPGYYEATCKHCGAVRKDEQIGLEQTPRLFIESLVQVFKECHRVLADDGTCWVNIGDSYARTPQNETDPNKNAGFSAGRTCAEARNGREIPIGMKPKDIIGIPWMLAFALRDEVGFYLRQDIIWYKKNPMPESVTDRCTKAHEYIFLLSKKRKYFYDADAIKTEVAESSVERLSQDIENQNGSYGPGKANGPMKAVGNIASKRRASGIVRDRLLNYDSKESKIHPTNNRGTHSHESEVPVNMGLANKRSVWEVVSTPYKGIHYAVFPVALAEPMIKAGTSEHGCCASCGKQYTRIVKKTLIPTYKASYNSQVDKRDTMADSNDQGSNRMKDCHKPGWIYEIETIGWHKPCKCPTTDIKPAVVLDPFGGSGTVAEVAGKLNRNSILIDLNEKYVREDQSRRLHEAFGLFNNHTIIDLSC